MPRRASLRRTGLTLPTDANTRNAAQQQLEAAERDNFVSGVPMFCFAGPGSNPRPCRPARSHSMRSALTASQPAYLHTLANELANEQAQPFIRNAAGLAFKNALSARVCVAGARRR